MAKSKFSRRDRAVVWSALIVPFVIAAFGVSAASAQLQPSQSAISCAPLVECHAVDPRQLAWLASYIGQSTYYVTQDSRYKQLLAIVTADTTFHYGTDMPLIQAFQTILSGPARPVEARDGRYLLLSGCADAPCRRAVAFLWIDVQQGLGFGGIVFAPSNGEPTPTMTIFSGQVGDKVTTRDELPVAFMQDLDQWSKKANAPSTIARYFVNATGSKTVIPHNEDMCAEANPTPAGLAPCGRSNLAIAEKDVEAAAYVLWGRFADGSPERAALQAAQAAWAVTQLTTCSALQGQDGLACLIKGARTRAVELADPAFRIPTK